MSRGALFERLGLSRSRPMGWDIQWDGSGPCVRVLDPACGCVVLNPDEARALGIALIEAGGLAMGAWGQAQKDRAEDAEDAETERQLNG